MSASTNAAGGALPAGAAVGTRRTAGTRTRDGDVVRPAAPGQVAHDRSVAADRANDVAFEDVLAAAREGAEWAWDGIYSHLAPVVRGYLRGQRAPAPDDLVGEVFLQVVRDLHRFSGSETQFRSWVFTIAHHRLLDSRRYHARRPVEPTDDDVLAAAMPVADDDPADAVMTAMTTDEIHGLVESLTDDQRAALLLRVVGGLTIGEIAEVMDRRPGAVKQLQRRAIVSLRERLREQPYPIGDQAALTEVT